MFSEKVLQIFSSTGLVRENWSRAVRNSCRHEASDFSRRAKPTTRNDDGSCWSLYRWYKAGINFRAVRSPLAPKMTMVHASTFLRSPPPPAAESGEFKICMGRTFAQKTADFNAASSFQA